MFGINLVFPPPDLPIIATLCGLLLKKMILKRLVVLEFAVYIQVFQTFFVIYIYNTDFFLSIIYIYTYVF